MRRINRQHLDRVDVSVAVHDGLGPRDPLVVAAQSVAEQDPTKNDFEVWTYCS